MPLSIPTPRPDNSGGFMVIQYANASYKHRARFHLAPFNNSAWGYVSVGTGQEANVQATFTAIANVLKAFYTSDWSFSMQSLWQNNAGVITELFGWTVPSNVAGSTASAFGGTTADTEKIYNFHTNHGGRSRVVLLGPPASNAYDQAANVTATSGGNGSDQALVAYFTGTTTQVVGHDGYPLISPAHLTVTRNRRIRRKIGQA